MNIVADKKELTAEESLEIIGQALAHKKLTLSQGEHLLLIEAFQTLEKEIKKEKS